ncbi:MBL fold metallo-hydrolase [Ruegeria arenilitoris]|uniref:MBL fold metallo-hydrolase n=1 Tax=Ruegeria arenilitoris TaxID=1173585 RepID=UPI001480983C|nr:MBL fold metallo-hydrolase [Ruegeria arenilitoris]
MLLALPISGESFLLRRAGKNVLVDGGYKKDEIAHVLEHQIRDVQYLDVVVCTHGDGDHVGGLSALLEDWVGRVGQLWLPGRWVNVVPQLARDPAEFLNQLVLELDAELKKPSEEVVSMVRHAENEGIKHNDWRDTASLPETNDEPAISEWLDGYDQSLDPKDILPEPEWFHALRQAEEQLASDEFANRAFKSARRRVKYRQKRKSSGLEIQIALHWLGLIETAQAIRNLAVAAIRHKIPTRWFDYEGFAKTRKAAGGARGFLVPINAVEQATPPTLLARYMHLTQINRESLVFLAPPTRSRFGILFCADSPLGDGSDFSQSFLPHLPRRLRWSPIVATAPHHGSESNSIAYDHLQKWANVEVLLRAGGSTKQPGPTFLEQHRQLRLCTKCPKAGHVPMLTGVFAAAPYRWSNLIALGRRCDCSISRKA